MNKYYYIGLISLATFITARDLEEEFSRIYRNKAWGVNEHGEGTSGSGSTLQAAKEYMTFVERFIKDNAITTVVDAGCGDWEFAQHMNWAGIRYIGYDIVQTVIEKNIKRYSAPNIAFFQGNIIKTDLPAADLLLCKDVFQHLEHSEIMQFAPQLKKYKYCLITDGPTTNVYEKLQNFRRKIIYQYNGGGEIKKIILVEN